MLHSYRLVFLLICASLFSIQGVGQELDPELTRQWETREKVPVILLMKEQADLSQAQMLKGKVTKTTYVFERLNAVSARTQTRIKDYLSERGVDFQSFWVVNMLSANLTKNQAVELT